MKKNGLHKLQFRRHDNSPQSEGRLTSHPEKYFSKGTPSSLFCLLYVDDGAFTFQSWKELELGSSVIRDQCPTNARRYSLESIKTEAVFFPQPGLFKRPTPPPTPLHSPPHHFHSSPKPHRKANQPNENARMNSIIMHQKHKQLFYRTEEYSPSRNILNTLATTSHAPSVKTFT